MLRADSFLGRLARAARPGDPLVQAAASPRWARILAAGGLHARAEDAMAVSCPAAPLLVRPRVSWGSGHVLTVAKARRDLIMSVIAARVAARSAVSGLRETLDAVSSAALADTVVTVSHLLRLLAAAQDRAGDLSAAHAFARGMPPGAAPAPAMMRPRAIEEARAIGEHIRSGRPVIMSLTEVTGADARRLADFVAGFIFGVQGTIKPIAGETILLLPPDDLLPADDRRDAGYLAELHAALPAAIASVAQILSGVTDLSAPPPRLGWEASLASRIRAYAGSLHAVTLPLNLARTDLAGTTASVDDLAGAIWTWSTTWPSAEFAARVRASSDELTPGTYQVRTGIGHPPTGLFLPV